MLLFIIFDWKLFFLYNVSLKYYFVLKYHVSLISHGIILFVSVLHAQYNISGLLKKCQNDTTGFKWDV